MKLLRQIIQKKLDLHNEFMLKKQYTKGIWNFYAVYNICSSIYNIQQDKIIRDFYWKRLICNVKINKNLKKIHEIMKNDMIIIIKAFNQLNIEEKQDENLGDLDKPDCIGISAFEFPE